MAGEIVHNLRSSLDHLAAELVEAHGGEVGRHTAFPISRTESDWNGRVVRPGGSRRSPLEGIDPASETWRYIESFQPFKRAEDAEDHRLAALAAMSNRDKHDALDAIFVYPETDVFSMFTFSTQAGFVSGRALLDRGAPLEDGALLAEFQFDPSGPDPSLHARPQISFAISFGDPRATRERGDDFETIIAMVEEVVAA